MKDLSDLARVRRHNGLCDEAFWHRAGEEFRMACESRFVDCAGLATFAEGLDQTRLLYRDDPTLPKEVLFDEAWGTVEKVVALLTRWELVPFEFPLPVSCREGGP